MSNPSGNRWREGRPQSLNTPPPPQQRQQPPAQATTERTKASGGSDRANSQSHAPPVPQNRVPLTSQAGNAAASGNAWGAGDKTRAAGPAASTDEKVRRSAAEFNGEEVRTFLRGGEFRAGERKSVEYA
ncbi:MAG: hypothetical protein M1822_000563 [Bathelium mastoideum]|nr:MAG: hypothetical protein M1822_000563 [Bathelium mastoideum]